MNFSLPPKRVANLLRAAAQRRIPALKRRHQCALEYLPADTQLPLRAALQMPIIPPCCFTPMASPTRWIGTLTSIFLRPWRCVSGQCAKCCRESAQRANPQSWPWFSVLPTLKVKNRVVAGFRGQDPCIHSRIQAYCDGFFLSAVNHCRHATTHAANAALRFCRANCPAWVGASTTSTCALICLSSFFSKLPP